MLNGSRRRIPRTGRKTASPDISGRCGSRCLQRRCRSYLLRSTRKEPGAGYHGSPGMACGPRRRVHDKAGRRPGNRAGSAVNIAMLRGCRGDMGGSLRISRRKRPITSLGHHQLDRRKGRRTGRPRPISDCCCFRCSPPMTSDISLRTGWPKGPAISSVRWRRWRNGKDTCTTGMIPGLSRYCGPGTFPRWTAETWWATSWY